jgi:hypothetical protein
MNCAVVQTPVESAQVGQNEVCGEESGAHFENDKLSHSHGHLHDRTLQNGVYRGKERERTK